MKMTMSHSKTSAPVYKIKGIEQYHQRGIKPSPTNGIAKNIRSYMNGVNIEVDRAWILEYYNVVVWHMKEFPAYLPSDFVLYQFFKGVNNGDVKITSQTPNGHYDALQQWFNQMDGKVTRREKLYQQYETGEGL